MTSPTLAPDGSGFEALIFDWDGTLVDSREVCFSGLAKAMDDVGIRLDPDWYWPRQAIASPDMLIVWEQQFGQLPQPIDVIIERCRRYVMAAAGDLQVIQSFAAIARTARERGQNRPVGRDPGQIGVGNMVQPLADHLVGDLTTVAQGAKGLTDEAHGTTCHRLRRQSTGLCNQHFPRDREGRTHLDR